MVISDIILGLCGRLGSGYHFHPVGHERTHWKGDILPKSSKRKTIRLSIWIQDTGRGKGGKEIIRHEYGCSIIGRTGMPAWLGFREWGGMEMQLWGTIMDIWLLLACIFQTCASFLLPCYTGRYALWFFHIDLPWTWQTHLLLFIC